MPSETSQRTIIVGDDGSDESADAVALATVLGSALDAQLVHACVEGRSAARGLHELAVARDAVLIVVGPSHHARLGRVLPGTVANRLAHGSPCAIAVAPRGYASEACSPRVIEVAFDMSDEAEAAVRQATEIAIAAGAALRLVAVIDPVEYGYGPIVGSYEIATADKLKRSLEERTRELVDELPSQVRADPRVLRGDPCGNILAEAEKGVDLLVMGSRGYGPVPSVLLGSTSSRVLASAPCPVLIVPRTAQAGAGKRAEHITAAP